MTPDTVALIYMWARLGWDFRSVREAVTVAGYSLDDQLAIENKFREIRSAFLRGEGGGK